MRHIIQKHENIMVVCSACGEAVSKKSNFCSSCGVRLNGSEKAYENKFSGADSKKKNVSHTSGNNGKQLSVTKIIYLVVALAGIGLIVLFASGILNSSSTPAQVSGAEAQGVPSKLEAIQQINTQEELVKNNPGNMEYVLTLAHLYNDNGFYPKAIEKYKLYLKANPKEADVIVDMGVCYYNLGSHKEAIESFKKGIEINPKHQIAHMNMGVVYNSGLNNKTEALKWWKKAYELNPSSDIGKRAQEFLNQNK